MADEMLNGRLARSVVAGLLTEYPRDAGPVSRPVTDLGLLP